MKKRVHPGNGGRLKVSKGRRKRLQRRAEIVGREQAAGRGERALSNRILEGLLEIRHRAKAGLVDPIFPFVNSFVHEIEALWGPAVAAKLRPLIEAEAAEAVAGVFDKRLYRLTSQVLARLRLEAAQVTQPALKS